MPRSVPDPVPGQLTAGFGIGLRTEHYTEVLEGRATGGAASGGGADFFEVISENYMDSGGRPLAVLETVRRDRPVVLHGVGLSIGSTDPVPDRYLERLKKLIDRIQPPLVSDHLCWTGAGGHNTHDLLPMPHTSEAIDHIVARVGYVQEKLGRQILLENISSYIWYEQSEMPEWEFLSAIVKKSGCGILLDVNNIYVNSVNHGFVASDFVNGVPLESVRQIHLAGYTDMGSYLFDTHNALVSPPVWELYRYTVARMGRAAPTLIEWDSELPPLAELLAENDRARRAASAALSSGDALAGVKVQKVAV